MMPRFKPAAMPVTLPELAEREAVASAKDRARNSTPVREAGKFRVMRGFYVDGTLQAVGAELVLSDLETIRMMFGIKKIAPIDAAAHRILDALKPVAPRASVNADVSGHELPGGVLPRRLPA